MTIRSVYRLRGTIVEPTYWDFAWMAIGLLSGFAIGRWPTYRRRSAWIEPSKPAPDVRPVTRQKEKNAMESVRMESVRYGKHAPPARDGVCKNCGNDVYRAQNYPMDGGWHWLHTVSEERRCLVFAEPDHLITT